MQSHKPITEFLSTVCSIRHVPDTPLFVTTEYGLTLSKCLELPGKWHHQCAISGASWNIFKHVVHYPDRWNIYIWSWLPLYHESTCQNIPDVRMRRPFFPAHSLLPTYISYNLTFCLLNYIFRLLCTQHIRIENICWKQAIVKQLPPTGSSVLLVWRNADEHKMEYLSTSV